VGVNEEIVGNGASALTSAAVSVCGAGEVQSARIGDGDLLAAGEVQGEARSPGHRCGVRAVGRAASTRRPAASVSKANAMRAPDMAFLPPSLLACGEGRPTASRKRQYLDSPPMAAFPKR